jgi:N-acetylneuraminic acid mutarotase
LQELAAVRLEERIVIAGGFENAATPVAQVRAYSPGAGWVELPSLPDTRHHIGLAAHEGDLYVLGGMRGTSFEPIARSYVLRSGADAWEEIAPMPVPRAAGFAASVGGTIVVAGGQGEGRSAAERLDAAADVLLYDPASDRWTRGAPIPEPREHVAGVSHEGQVWIFGGRPLSLEPTSGRVDIYDVALNAWSEGPAMPSPRGGFAAAEREGTVVVTGGEERSGALASSDVLDLRTRTWAEGPDMMSARHGHGMAALGDSLFAIGGADRPIFSPIDGVERITP